MRTYRDLKVWQAAYSLALDLHRECAHLPVDERFEMARDLKRTSRSIISNIAEGSGRRTIPERVNFLNIASGSASELESQILLSGDLDFIPANRLERYLMRIAEIRRMLYAMMAALLRTQKPGPKRRL